MANSTTTVLTSTGYQTMEALVTAAEDFGLVQDNGETITVEAPTVDDAETQTIVTLEDGRLLTLADSLLVQVCSNITTQATELVAASDLEAGDYVVTRAKGFRGNEPITKKLTARSDDGWYTTFVKVLEVAASAEEAPDSYTVVIPASSINRHAIYSGVVVEP